MCEHLDEFSSVCLYFGPLFLKVGVSEIKLFHYKLCFYIYVYLHANESAKLAKKRFLFFHKKQKSK